MKDKWRHVNGGKKALLKILGVILCVLAFLMWLFFNKGLDDGTIIFNSLAYIRIFFYLAIFITGIVLLIRN